MRSPTGRQYLVGLDVGTTRVKAVAVDVSGTVGLTVERPTPWQHTPDGVEMAADDLTDVVRTVVRRACARVVARGDAVAGIGVTGMAEAGVLTTDDLVPLAPVRAWHDPRADPDVVRDALGPGEFERATGMPLSALPSLTKILRLRGDVPASAEATRFYSVPEWAVLVLGGAPGSELSLASRTGLLALDTATSWAGAVELLGVDLLRTPQPAGTAMGTAVRVPDAETAVLTVAGHDHQSAALAAGAARPGVLFDSLGTAEALLRFIDVGLPAEDVGRLVAARVTVGRTVTADQLCLLAGMRTGMLLEQLACELGARRPDRRIRLAGDPRWHHGVIEAIAPARARVLDVNSVAGEHDAVLGAGGWFQDPVVLAAKRAQLPGLLASGPAEAGAVGAAYLSGVAAQTLRQPSALIGPQWSTARPRS